MAVSKMLEGLCADIEDLAADGLLRQAVRHAVALPEICSALEDPAMRGNDDHYLAWCARWVYFPHGKGAVTIGLRLQRLHKRSGRNAEQSLTALRMRRNARSYQGTGRPRMRQPANRLEAFELALSLILADAARRWYAGHGRTDRTVQTNLGRLLIAR
jgi:hypothetical protein